MKEIETKKKLLKAFFWSGKFNYFHLIEFDYEPLASVRHKVSSAEIHWKWLGQSTTKTTSIEIELWIEASKQ